MAKGQRSKRSRPVKKANRAPWIIGTLGVAALLVVPVVVNVVQAANLPGERFASQGNRHVPLGAAIAPYNSEPPTSGPHTDALAPWGSYLPGDAPPDLNLVHNMEDGGVIIWYRPTGNVAEDEATVAQLESVAARYRRVVIVPRVSLDAAFTLTAWQRLQRFDAIDPDGMTAFLEAFEGIDHHVP